jgi:hypothetical protein
MFLLLVLFFHFLNKMSLLQPTFRYSQQQRPLSIHHLLNDEPLNEPTPKKSNQPIKLPPINTLLVPSETLDKKVALEKAKRKRILPYQYQCLVQCFERTDSPNSELRERLALELNMTKREVQVKNRYNSIYSSISHHCL